MARKKRKFNLTSPFVAMTWEVLNSPAHLALNYASRAALPFFFGKPKVPFNRPDFCEIVFIFPYSEAKRLGYPTATFSKVIRELVATGFIDPQEKGGLRGNGRVANRFTMSRRWKDYGTPDFRTLDWSTFIPKPRKKQEPQQVAK